MCNCLHVYSLDVQVCIGTVVPHFMLARFTNNFNYFEVSVKKLLVMEASLVPRHWV